MNNLLTVAIEAAQDAGREVMKLYETTDFETKLDGSPVTIADTKAHNIIVQHLEVTGVAVLSEESESIAVPYPSRLWVIDPIDGTRDFLKKTGDFAVMIALLEHGQPVLGVVYAPAQDKLYYASKGNGAYLVHNGTTERLMVSNRDKENLTCIQSANHFSKRSMLVLERLKATGVPHGSIGIKAGLIAEGIGDFSFSWGNLGEWDVCAPEIIAREAGGEVTDCLGTSLIYGTPTHHIGNGYLLSNGACHAHVLRVIQETPPTPQSDQDPS